VAWVKASFNSIRGDMVSNWKHGDGKFSLKISIPANTSATVYVPTKSANTVTEDGKPAAQSDGVKFLRVEGNCAVYAVESGNYEFQSAF
jgi:alpha-L-rhamnosidase